MKPLNIVILAFALSIAASTAYGSDIIDDVVKLQRAGIENEVTLHFVQDSNSSSDLSADDIQRLEDAGVSSSVIVAMLDRSKELRDDPTKIHVNAAQSLLTPEPHTPYAAENTHSTTVADPRSYNSYTDVVAPSEGQANISLFYEALSPYGTWSQDAGNGWVWQPADGARDPNWRPYANDGHWTWTNHGWYWESTSPYGWATFHYGRWGYNSEHRWSWSPDNVWGPAWVDWRHSDDYIGWAPLPFGSRFEADIGFSYHGRQLGFDFHSGMEERDYAFVSANSFLNGDLGNSFIPEGRRHNVYNETKIVNNTYVYNDNRIINNGVPTTIVSRATRRQIEQVKVVDANIAAGQPIRGDTRSANTIAAYRPKIANKASVEPPAIAERRKLAAAQQARNAEAATLVRRNSVPSEPAVHTSVTSRTQARDASESEKQSRQRLIDEKEKRRSAQKESAATNAAAAAERSSAKLEIAKERKAESVATKEAQVNARANAAAERKAGAAADKEAQVKVHENAAIERKAALDAKNESLREERNESKEEKAREKKDGQK